MKRIGAFALLLGSVLTLGSAWFILAGPTATNVDSLTLLLGAAAALVMGLVVSGWGASRFVGVGARI